MLQGALWQKKPPCYYHPHIPGTPNEKNRKTDCFLSWPFGVTYRPILGCSPPLTTGAPGIAIYLISPHTPLHFLETIKVLAPFLFSIYYFFFSFPGNAARNPGGLPWLIRLIRFFSPSSPISFSIFLFRRWGFLSFSWCHIWSRTDNIYSDLAILIRYCRPPLPHMLAKHNAYPCFACIVGGGDWRLFFAYA